MPNKRIWWLGGGASLLLACVGLLWWMDFDPTTWYRLRSLSQAIDSNRADSAERVAELGWSAQPGLIRLLRSGDEVVCQNAQAGLACLYRRCGPDDPQMPGQIQKLASAYPALPPMGQAALLRVASESLPEGTNATPEVRAAWLGVLSEVNAEMPENVRVAGLELADWLLKDSPSPETFAPARQVIQSCLTAEEPSVRLRAVQMSLVPGLELEKEIARLLRDPVVEVRRAAIVVAGPAPRVLDETLLPSLRDPDPDVQQLAEAALRGRGLTSQHIKLGRMLTDSNPRERLKVLDHLQESAELEPSVWLRRLSHDPADSVRATTVRVMAEQTMLDMTDRLEQMRRSDPSPTVSQLAGFYLKQGRQSEQ